MLLLITCRSLEIADRSLTTAVKLVLPPALVPGSPSWVRQLVGQCVLHRWPLPQRGPATRRLHLSAPLLLARFVRADVHASALSVDGFGGFHRRGSSRAPDCWPIIRPHPRRSCRPSTIRFLSN